MPQVLSGIPFNVSYAWLGLGLVMVLSAILTVVYFFHWRRYSMNTGVAVLSEVIYLLVMATLFIAASVSLIQLA